MSNLPALIIDFEATDISSEAEATQIGYCHVEFRNNQLMPSEERDSVPAKFIDCRPDRRISFGAMSVAGITYDDIKDADNHQLVVRTVLPVGQAYIIGHNIDYDIQVAQNAGIDTSQYKRICTQALARHAYPDADSHNLGALTYMLHYNLARTHVKNAHNAGYDVTFTRWLLKSLCQELSITSMDQLYLVSEAARIPKTFTFGKYFGKSIADMGNDIEGRKYLRWAIGAIDDKPYLTKACKQALGAKQ